MTADERLAVSARMSAIGKTGALPGPDRVKTRPPPRRGEDYSNLEKPKRVVLLTRAKLVARIESAANRHLFGLLF